LNYQWVDDDLLIAGLMLHDYPIETAARKKMRSKLRTEALAQEELERVVERRAEATDDLEAELQSHMDSEVARYRKTKGYQRDILKALKPELKESLAQIHDYKQFVQQVVNNVDVMLEAKYPGIPLEEKIEKATHEEKAIYWAALIMDEKLEGAQFLESPGRIYEKREQGRCRPHGMVVKYARIYQRRADLKRLKVKVSGESWGEIVGNTRALGIIPHTLIDNALKYAPEGSRVEISFSEDSQHITLSVSSMGPRIRDDERERIFDLSYRGSAARRKSKEGTGFGLASAQNIAAAHDTRIEVEQSLDATDGFYLTTFSVSFKRA
jgi:signal transduction histidine kinase